MALLDDVGDFAKATAGEIGHHPLQALGAALGVPGYDPFFGGLFNNHEGGALLSPTGNFTSSAWGEMYKDNPNATGGLDLFHRVNSIADIIAPAVAGGLCVGRSRRRWGWFARRVGREWRGFGYAGRRRRAELVKLCTARHEPPATAAAGARAADGGIAADTDGPPRRRIWRACERGQSIQSAR